MVIYSQHIPASHLPFVRVIKSYGANIYHHHIPCSHLLESQAIAPPRINLEHLSEKAASAIAEVIVHEAEHQEQWRNKYFTGKKDLGRIDIPEEERIAEDAVGRAGLQTTLTDELFDTSEKEDVMSAEEILNRALRIANSKQVQVPRHDIEEANLGPDQWGQYEMTQEQWMLQNGLEYTTNQHILWDNKRNKLVIDVNAIIDSYNRQAVEEAEGMKTQTQPATYQDDGMQQDVPGVSQGVDTGVPSAPAAPTVEAR